MFPGVPVWPGPLTEWPAWWIEDYKILIRTEAEIKEKKDKERDGMKEAEDLRLKLRKKAIGE